MELARFCLNNCYVFRNNMNKLLFIIGVLVPFGVSAKNCMSGFSEEKMLSEIIQGNQIYTPFILGHLIDGKYEPEMIYKELNITSLKKITKIVNAQYKHALTRGAEKLIKENKEYNEIIFRGPNSGYYIEYKFKNIMGCWKLVGFSNGST